MTKTISYLAVTIMTVVSAAAEAQIRVTGSFNSHVYTRENAAQNQHSDFYQGLYLRVTPENYTNLTFQTNLRAARRGDPAAWDERIYHAYMQWRSSNSIFAARMGRQFVYHGVINGTLDALQLIARPSRGLEIRFIGGGDAPMNREFSPQDWDSSQVFGGFLSYRHSRQAKIDLSYFERSRNNERVWQQIGSALSGWLSKGLSYNAQVDYNVLKEEYQAMRYRLIYSGPQWGFSAEFNSQKPRIYEDSFFNIFQLSAYNQFRFGVTYQMGDYRIGLQERLTRYEEDSGNEWVLTAASIWGNVGLIYQSGFGGDNVGVFGGVRFDVAANLQVRVRSSHFRFERHSIRINEEATSFSGGLYFRPGRAWQLKAEVQESINSFYKNDFRGLFGINYSFNQAIR